ncbi:ParB/RepB/Spo0J family partition protein [Vibrio owensii]|uniref:ParB/RepB/Spo0J family partition protein n=1 Tax=Vibrio owensii TaxID=696485 RepID=UPI003CC5C42D
MLKPTTKKDQVFTSGMSMRKLAAAVKQEGVKLGRTDIYVAPFDLLYVEEGFNIRDIDWKKVEFFKKMYIEGRQLPPLDVQPVEVNGEHKLKVFDGHHRYYGISAAIKEGHEIKGTKVNEIIGNAGDMLFHMIGTTQGRPLSPMERARAYQRLINQGYTQSEIATRLDQSQASVSNALMLVKADKRLQDMIQDGEIGVSRALELIREYGPERATQAAILDTTAAEEAVTEESQQAPALGIVTETGDTKPVTETVAEQPKKRRPAGLKKRSLGKKSVESMSNAVREISSSLETQIESDSEVLSISMSKATALKLLSLAAELEGIEQHNGDVDKKIAELTMAAKDEQEVSAA